MDDPRPHLLHVFSTFVAAGPQVRTVGLIERFGDAFRHTLVAMDGRVDAAELLPPGALEVVEPPPRAGSLKTLPAMRKRIRAVAPDAVLTYNFGAMDAALAARTLGLPLVHHEDGFLPDEADRQLKRRGMYRRVALSGARAVVVISENLQRIALEQWRLRPALVHFIPNGIDVRRFEPRDGNPALRAELGLPADALVVGAVGHLRVEKNLPRLIEALALCADERLHLLALGDGPERGAIEAAAEAHGLRGRVHLVGHRADPRPYYRAMDVFASASDTEQMPISLLEAMASALPAAATDVGDVRAMLPEEQRHLVTPTEAPALAAALGTLAGDPGLRAELGRANRARAEERFDRDAMTRTYQELYASAAG